MYIIFPQIWYEILLRWCRFITCKPQVGGDVFSLKTVSCRNHQISSHFLEQITYYKNIIWVNWLFLQQKRSDNPHYFFFKIPIKVIIYPKIWGKLVISVWDSFLKWFEKLTTDLWCSKVEKMRWWLNNTPFILNVFIKGYCQLVGCSLICL